LFDAELFETITVVCKKNVYLGLSLNLGLAGAPAMHGAEWSSARWIGVNRSTRTANFATVQSINQSVNQ